MADRKIQCAQVIEDERCEGEGVMLVSAGDPPLLFLVCETCGQHIVGSKEDKWAM